MVFLGGGPPEPVNDDPRAVRRAALQDHHNRVGLIEDLAVVSRWIGRVPAAPVRLLARALRR